MQLKNIFFCCAILFSMHTMAQSVLTIHGERKGATINPSLYGLFFEEINHAGDGGLYAELIQNRSFEDHNKWPIAWSAMGQCSLQLINEQLLNSAQQQALRISGGPQTGVANSGYWGIHAVKGRTYTLSFWARSLQGYKGSLTAALCSKSGQSYGSAQLKGVTTKWKKFTATLSCTENDAEAQFKLLLNAQGTIDLDVVSLFPPTFKNRKNGLRPDLAQMLADIRPAFIRFPGGCYVEGVKSIDDAFNWRKTIGPIEQRPGHPNYVWGYRSSDGLGFDEYLQMCEDMNADPLFVVNIGLGHEYNIPLDKLAPQIQDVMEALEYANGDAKTPMGKLRAQNGHPAPYGIKYIELGNENYQTGDDPHSLQYSERYEMFRRSIMAKYPTMKIIGNVEAWGTDHPTWRNSNPVDLLDEHYYRSHSWMRDNFTKYDSYDRSKALVYNGEYAANQAGTYGKNGTIQSALGEAIYMMGMERNGDVCAMASFAPIFTHEKNRAWDYDMIHFTASQSFATPSYYVQQLFSTNLGYQNLQITEKNNLSAPLQHISVGLGTWNTGVEFSDFAILDKQGQFLAKGFPQTGTSTWKPRTGNWKHTAETYAQTEERENCTSIFSAYIPSTSYEINVNARKLSGKEGFLIVFNYQDENNYCWWNIGGWGNTSSAIERNCDGKKATYNGKPFQIKTGQTYQIKLTVQGNILVGTIDGVEIVRTTLPEHRAVYSCAELNEKGDQLIVKLVNPEAQTNQVELRFNDLKPTKGSLVQLKGNEASDENTLEQPTRVIPSAPRPIDGVAASMKFEAQPYSLSILTFQLK